MTSIGVNRTPPMEAPMTTDCITHHQAVRFDVTPLRRELVEAVIAGAAIILLLPGAALVMSALTAA